MSWSWRWRAEGAHRDPVVGHALRLITLDAVAVRVGYSNGFALSTAREVGGGRGGGIGAHGSSLCSSQWYDDTTRPDVRRQFGVERCTVRLATTWWTAPLDLIDAPSGRSRRLDLQRQLGEAAERVVDEPAGWPGQLE